MDPDYVEALFGLGLAYDQKQMYNEAIRELKRAIDLSNSRPIIVAALGQIYARIGRQEEAEEIHQILKARHLDEGVSDFYQAIVDVSLGNIDSNMDIIQRAYDEHFGLLVYIKVEPLLDPFRAEPWYQQLIKKMNL
jgi:tetratricopeptide (TPR) repeat protein